MPKQRVPHLKQKKDVRAPATMAEKLEFLVGKYQSRKSLAKRNRKEPVYQAEFRRPVTKSDTIRIYRLRHSGSQPPLSYAKIGQMMRMPTMTVFQAYKRFTTNGNKFVDGNLRKGKYQHGKLVGDIKDFLLNRQTLQEWSGFSLQHRCHLIKKRLRVAVDPSTLMRFYKRNGIKYYTLAYRY